MSNELISIMFNSQKIKYSELDLYFKRTDIEKTIYFCLDFDYIMGKYLYAIDYDKDVKFTEQNINEFITEFLNLIAHYKRYFYNNLDAMSFFYIGINVNKYKSDENITTLIKKLIPLITMIPRIYIYYYDNFNQGFFMKYNLIRTICINRSDSNKEILFFDLCKFNMNELIYKLTKKYYFFINNDGIHLYGFNNFKEENLSDVEPLYINTVINLLTIYETLNELQLTNKFKVDNIIMDFIKKHRNEDFNDIKTKLLIIKKFTKMKKIENRLKKLEGDLNSIIYKNMIEVTMRNWKHIIKDNSIYKVNEILNVPKNKRINIELLMNY